jgi:hypothetical protein
MRFDKIEMVAATLKLVALWREQEAKRRELAACSPFCFAATSGDSAFCFANGHFHLLGFADVTQNCFAGWSTITSPDVNADHAHHLT